jgi:predicted outer membrane repeat protein
VKLSSRNVDIRTVETKVYTTDVTVIVDNSSMVISTSGNNQTSKSLSQYISDIETGGNNDNDLTPGNLPEGTLAQKLNYIASQSASNVLYDIVIGEDLLYGPAQGKEYITSKGQNVTIHIHSASASDIKTVQLSVNNNNIFAPQGVTLRLSNIILKGITNTPCSIIYVLGGGTLIIDDGTVITGNSVISGYDGSGVYVDENSTLIMNGGKITGNNGTIACGVGLSDTSTFIMNGGEISGNTANDMGGGVVVFSGSTFIMHEGKINGNTANDMGGGVLIFRNGNFIMNGGEISGNTSENGGGVMLVTVDNSSESLTMNGGIIKGNSASDTGGGIYAVDRTLTQNGGGSRITVSIIGGEIINNTAKYGGGIALYNSRLTKTGGYIAGTDGGINANNSTQNEGDAILYCRDTTFWDRKSSLTQSDNISTDNMNNGWTYLGEEGTF